MGIDDEYTAYCFDEACSYIVSKILDGEEPKFIVEYKSVRDIYRHYRI